MFFCPEVVIHFCQVGREVGSVFNLFVSTLPVCQILVTLLNRLPLESKGKNLVTFVCGIRLLNLEETCPLREDLPLHFREITFRRHLPLR